MACKVLTRTRLIDADAFVKKHTEFAENFHALGNERLAEFHRNIASAVEIEDIVELPRWIPVEERLPEEAERVLTWRGKDGINAECWTEWEGWELTALLSDERVTHWMPLPEPPEEG